MSDTDQDSEDRGQIGKTKSDEARLSQGLVRGLAWFSGARWGGQLISWASTLVIARLLAPDDFGIVAAAMVVIGFLDIATDLGIGPAIVQREQLSRESTEQAAGLTLLLSVAFALVTIGVAPVWAQFQGDPRITEILVFLSVAILMTGLGTVSNALLRRNLRFRDYALSQLVNGIATAAVTLGSAVVFRSYWALILGFLSGRALQTAIVIYLEPVRPRIRKPGSEELGMLRFGGTYTLRTIVWYFRSNVDILIIGATLGAQALGYYAIAMNVARVPMDKLAGVITPVLFPVLSRSQGNPKHLARQYVGLSAGTALLILPAGVGIALSAPELVPVLLGTQWVPSVETTQWISVTALVVMLRSFNAPALDAIGRVGITFRFELLLAIIAPLLMLFGARWGIEGVAAAGLVAILLIACWAFPVTWRMIQVDARNYFRRLWMPISATSFMTVVVLLSRLWMLELSAPLRLILTVAVGVLSYGFWLLLVHRNDFFLMLRTLRSAWRGEEA